MWKRYQSHLIASADRAAADPNLFRGFLGERLEGALWGLPLFPSIAVAWLFKLSGLPAVLVVLPAMVLFVAGGLFYVPLVFSKAKRKNANGS